MSRSIVHITIAFLVLAGLVFLNVTAVLNPVLDWGRVGAGFLAYPAVKVFDRVNEFFIFFSQLRHLAAENQLLGKRVENLTGEVANLEKAREENRFLRDALGFQTETKNALIPAEVIAWDPLNADQKITLSRGARQGVTEGASVVVAGNILVGVISKVLGETSQMDLLTSSDVVVNAQVVPGGATGIIKGEHGLGLSFDLVSQNEVIKNGDRVLTSGLGGRFPKNLLIGEVGRIRSGESELFQKASVIPATNLRSLRFVFVLKQ